MVVFRAIYCQKQANGADLDLKVRVRWVSLIIRPAEFCVNGKPFNRTVGMGSFRSQDGTVSDGSGQKRPPGADWPEAI